MHFEVMQIQTPKTKKMWFLHPPRMDLPEFNVYGLNLFQYYMDLTDINVYGFN